MLAGMGGGGGLRGVEPSLFHLTKIERKKVPHFELSSLAHLQPTKPEGGA